MKKLIIYIAIGIFGIGILTTNAQLRTFVSEQLGSGPSNGEVLQTDGSNSTWVSPTGIFSGLLGNSMLVGTDASGVLVSTSTPTAAAYTATSTTATSTFAGGFTVGNSKFVVNNFNGNIGIGTTTPNVLLEIQKSSGGVVLGASTGAFRITNSTNGVGQISELQFSNSGDVSNSKFAAIGGSYQNGNGNTAGDILFGTRPTITDANLTTSMIIKMGGNVGIGSTTPYASLSVTNTSASPSFVVEDSASPDTTPFFIGNSGLVGIGTVAPLSNLGILGNASIGATYGNIAAPTSGIIVEGNVGIGISAPAATLDIAPTGADPTMRLRNNTSGYQLTSRVNGASAEIGSNNGTPFYLLSGTGNQTLQLYTNDLVGIGLAASTPAHELDIATLGNTTAKTAAFSTLNTSNTATSTTASIIKAGVSIRSTGLWTGTGSSNIGLYVSSVTGGTSNYDAIFNGGGNVGFGTTTPNNNLQVNTTAATTTISATVVNGSTRSTTKGGKIILQDTSGGTCTEITTQAGVMSSKAVTCP